MRLPKKHHPRIFVSLVSILIITVLMGAFTIGAQAAEQQSSSAAASVSIHSSHAAYLDLTTNITDLRSRVSQWQKGDEASLGIAKEKFDRVRVVLASTIWPETMTSSILKTRAALDLMANALDAKDQAAAELASKAFGDASHDVIHSHYGDWLPSLKGVSLAPMATHPSYLDLSANIADLRSRISLWEKGDEASLGIAKEKAERIGVLTKHTASIGVLSKPALVIDKALPQVNAALEQKDPVAAQMALKPIADASHDLTHDFYAWVGASSDVGDAACVQASYIDVSANITDLKARVTAWEGGDEASLGIAQEKLERIDAILGHATWPSQLNSAITKAESALPSIQRALKAKDVVLAQAALKPVSDASHDLTHSYYGDWLPTAFALTEGDHQMSDGAQMSGGHGGHGGAPAVTQVQPSAQTQPASPSSASQSQADPSAGGHAHGAEAMTETPAGPNWLVLGLFAAPILLGTVVVTTRRKTSAISDGFPDASEPRRMNLLDNKYFRRVFESRLYPGVLQAAAILVFSVIVYELLFGPAKAHDNFGTAMTWVLWWPLIPLFFLLLGRFWCAVCPFATLSDLVQKVVGQNRPVPQFLKKYGIWIIDAVFILITWSDHTFGIVESPRGSGVLLVGLILGVVTAGLLFERRTWCRYLCFLGGLSGNYSRSGMLELRATPSVCKTCNVKACYKGNEKAPGCPMFEFPRAMDTNARCNLCGYCVKTCPNDSIRISPRMATSELWSIRRPKFEEAFLACVIMGVVFVQNITMLQVWREILSWLEGVVGTSNYFVTFTITFAVLMALPVVALFGASYLSRVKGKHTTIQLFTLFGYALIPLDLAGHLAHNLFHLLAEGKAIAFTGLELFGIASTGSPALVDNLTIQILQFALVVLGTIASIYTAYRLAKSRSESKEVLRRAFAPVAILMVLLGAINLFLFYLPMAMRM